VLVMEIVQVGVVGFSKLGVRVGVCKSRCCGFLGFHSLMECESTRGGRRQSVLCMRI
jgi:hypothetical protein